VDTTAFPVLRPRIAPRWCRRRPRGFASDAASAEAPGADKAGEGESRDINATKIYQESPGTSRDEKTTRYLEGRSSRFLFVIGGVVVSNVYTCRVALRSAKVLEGIGIGYVWCYGASE
jgi:hypothetical protein